MGHVPVQNKLFAVYLHCIFYLTRLTLFLQSEKISLSFMGPWWYPWQHSTVNEDSWALALASSILSRFEWLANMRRRTFERENENDCPVSQEERKYHRCHKNIYLKRNISFWTSTFCKTHFNSFQTFHHNCCWHHQRTSFRSATLPVLAVQMECRRGQAQPPLPCGKH